MLRLVSRHAFTDNCSSNGEFQQTTNTDENVFVKNGLLHIKPTLQDAALIANDHVIDLRGNGCTGANWQDCVTATNTTNGTIVNPVKSARINTRLSASIKFGRVEVVAKLPAGDWLWPAIWMLPKDNKYGDWPRSGEIDIAESRGNNWTFSQGGNNVVSSALHFGPNPGNDGWWRNNVKRRALHTSYSSGYNTFGVEVSPPAPSPKAKLISLVEREIHIHLRQHTAPPSNVHAF